MNIYRVVIEDVGDGKRQVFWGTLEELISRAEEKFDRSLIFFTPERIRDPESDIRPGWNVIKTLGTKDVYLWTGGNDPVEALCMLFSGRDRKVAVSLCH